MGKESYKLNSLRVREIYGVAPNDHRYNIHHIIFRSDVDNRPELFKGFDVDQVSNLCPLLRHQHEQLHEGLKSLPKERKKHVRVHHKHGRK